MLREVLITVSNIKTGDHYMARSFPHRDYDRDGLEEYYKVDVYKVFLDGTDEHGNPVRREWPAPRFMPYWNDPKNPDRDYDHIGWADSGKHYKEKHVVRSYDPKYKVHNMPSESLGAIPIHGAFLIHAGPPSLTDEAWASAGCVEIIGSFDAFRRDILRLAGSTETDINKGMLQVVAARKLSLQVDLAKPPEYRKKWIEERVPVD